MRKIEKIKKLKSIILALALLCAPLQLFPGGVCLYEISSSDTRLASAGWSARANDPSTLFTNPAGMTRLCGKQAELGTQTIFGHFNFDPSGDTTVLGSNGKADIWLPSGSFFYTQPTTDNLTLGFGSLGYFGSDLVFNHGWVGRYYVQKILLEGISFVPAAAYKLNDLWSIGAGVNVMYAFFKQRAALRNLLDGGNDGYFNMHDYRFGCGGVFGILFEPTCSTRFGLQYLTPVNFDFKAKPNFKNVGPLLEQALRGTGVIGSNFHLHVNVPQSLMFSAYHDITPCWSIMGNLGWQQWSRFQKASITLADTSSTSLTIKNHYQDTWHAALGTEWYPNESWTFSGGIAYDSSAITNKNRPLDFPIGDQWRFGTGARWNITENLVFDFSMEFLWQGNLKVNVNKGILAGHVVGKFKNTYGVFLNSNVIYLF